MTIKDAMKTQLKADIIETSLMLERHQKYLDGMKKFLKQSMEALED